LEQIPELAEAGKPAQGTLAWKDGYGFSKELGNKIHSGNLPGDVYQALKTVREGLLEHLQNKLPSVAKDQFKTIRNDWHRMESTFADRGSLTTGGSPIANMLAVENQLHGFKFSGHLAAGPLVGKGAKLAAAMLEEYKTLGTQPEIAARIRTANEALKEMGATPKRPKLPARQLAKLTEEDIAQMKADEVRALAERLGGNKGLHPLFDLLAVMTAAKTQSFAPLAYPVSRRLAGYGLRSEPMIKLLSKTTKKDVAALRRQK
jgi:hypothetical protein